MTAVAEFTDLSKSYRDSFPWRRETRAVEGVSFAVDPGEVFGLVGPNRAGKTTLIKVLLTLTRPTSGEAKRWGRPVGDRSTLRAVGYMHENQAFPRYWNARGLLHYYGSLSGVNEEVRNERVPDLIERVGLSDRADEPIRRFSKGMVQRLALAQALINDPDLLVLDEPTEGLDLEGRRLLHDVVRSRREAGKSVILVSHLANDVEQLCDRVGVMVAGRLRHLGRVSEMARPFESTLRSIYESERS